MLRLLKYLPVVLSVIGVIRKNRAKTTAKTTGGRSGTRRNTSKK